jgi:hypothetical protein
MTDRPPAGERPADESAETQKHRRGLRFRRREDYALELFKEALGDLTDVARVDRILVELGRFYNPLLDAPIVDVATRARVMESLGRGRWDEARRLLEERMSGYAPPTEGDAGDR